MYIYVYICIYMYIEYLWVLRVHRVYLEVNNPEFSRVSYTGQRLGDLESAIYRVAGVAVQELKMRGYNKETLSSTIYTYCGNFY